MSELENKVEIEVVAMNNGWQSILLKLDETGIGFLASYVGDTPLSSLITLAAEIDIDIEDEEVPCKRHKEWYQEPGTLQIILECDGTVDEITIKKTNESIWEDDQGVIEVKDPYETYHFKVKHEAFKNAVIAEAIRILKEYGIRGYNENWNDGPDNFPVAALLQLLGNKANYDEDSETSTSSLEEEVNLLKSIL